MALRRRKEKINWHMLLLTAFLVVLLFVVCRWVYGLYVKKQDALLVYEETYTKHQRLLERLDMVEDRNGELDSDTGWRDFLFEKRGLIGTGERVLILVESDQGQSKQTKEPVELPWWKQLFN